MVKFNTALADWCILSNSYYYLSDVYIGQHLYHLLPCIIYSYTVFVFTVSAVLCILALFGNLIQSVFQVPRKFQSLSTVVLYRCMAVTHFAHHINITDLLHCETVQS